MPPPAPNTKYRRSFACCGKSFSFSSQNILDNLLMLVTVVVEKFVLILGPLLICFALAIIGGLSHTFFTILLPMIQHKHAERVYFNGWISPNMIVGAHVLWVFFLLTQIMFNYYCCVATSNHHDAKKNPAYPKVVRELAEATHMVYPETPQELASFRQDFEDRMLLRMKRRQIAAAKAAEASTTNKTTASTNRATTVESTTTATKVVKSSSGNKTKNTSTTLDSPPPSDVEAPSVKQRKKTTTKQKPFPRPPIQPSPVQVRNWMLMAPDEWGFCTRSKAPKPPRSHYDHVSKSLVLCLDHYCPWMFNSIGYFNYRYFCNFLWFVEMGMIYGFILCYDPFQNSTGPLYRHQAQEFRRTGTWKHLYPMVPINSERLAISLAFMLCLAIGVAVAILGGFHLYLVLTGQTTIEFHGNWMNKRKAKRLNKKFKNPYDLGWRRNWQQVYGTQPFLKAFLIPSRREPEFLPLPIKGEQGKRKSYQNRNSGSAKGAEAKASLPVASIV